MKNIAAFIMFFMLFLLQYSLSNASEKSFQSLGASLSSYSGSGLSYRYHFNDRWGIQLSGGAVIDNNNKNVATGLEVQSDLTSLPDKRLYLIFSAGWYVDTESVFKKGGDSVNVNYIQAHEDISYFKLAVGFGGELAFGNSIVNNLTLGIGIFPIGVSIKEKHSYYGYDDTSKVNFGASIFTHFNF